MEGRAGGGDCHRRFQQSKDPYFMDLSIILQEDGDDDKKMVGEHHQRKLDKKKLRGHTTVLLCFFISFIQSLFDMRICVGVPNSDKS